MAKSVDHTSLLCLFHHKDHAKAALNDLNDVRIPQELISVLGGEGGDRSEDLAALKLVGVPERDLKHLEEGLADGGLIVLVRALTEHVADVEAIFSKHQAEKIDEAETAPSETMPTEVVREPLAKAAFPAVLAGAVPLAAAVDTYGQAQVPSHSASEQFATGSMPLADDTEEPGTVLLVSASEVLSGEADLALQALEEETLRPVEVVVVPDPPVREPIRPMQPYSQYRQVD